VSVLGIQTGTLVHVLGAALGLSAILLTSALAFDIVKYLGAAYLIYLGIRKLMERDTAAGAQDAPPASLQRIFSQGAVVSILNPKTALFFFSFLPQFVDPIQPNVPLQMLTLGVIFMLMALTTDSLYALAAGTAARWLRGNLKFLRFQRYFSGTIYIGLGLAAAFSGSSKK
jgi:threonine/homoserine/homoserine lactone efflux protein